MSILDSVVGMAVGGGAGLVMQQSSVAPVLRSAAAVALGYLGSMFIMSLMWASRMVESGVVALRFGSADAVIGLSAALAGRAAAHLVLGRARSALGKRVARYRPLTPGLLAA